MPVLAADSRSRPNARMIGLVYLLYFVTAISAQLFQKGIVVFGDPAATVANLQAHEPLFRLGLALSLVAIAWYVVLTALLYELLKPVNHTVSLIAAFFSLVGCAIQAVPTLFQLVPSVVLTGAPYLNVFKPDQLQALSLLLLKFGAQAFNMGLVFFGFYCLLLGVLIFRSAFLPKPIGALLALAGLGWLSYLSPHLVISLSPYIQIVGILAKASLMLWLLLLGINTERWKKQVSGAF